MNSNIWPLLLEVQVMTLLNIMANLYIKKENKEQL